MGVEMKSSVELTRLRARVDALTHRRVAALERLSPLPDSPSRRRLEAMRFELAELEWQLADLEDQR
jgi:polyhydroxyalkanoate synthesis regulator phasin